MTHFITKSWLGYVTVALAALLPAGTVASAQTLPPGNEDIVLSGFLNCSGTNAERACPFRPHYVQLTKDRVYCIRMESSEFTASLMLEDPSGNLLATNTDDFEAMPGCIIFRAPATERFRLIATSLPPTQEGFYMITIHELPVRMRVDAALSVTDPVQADSFHQTHEITLLEGRRYVIDLASIDFEPFVKLLDPDGMIVAFNDEASMPRPARIVFTASRDGNYRIVATSATPFATGAFTLTVCEEE